MFYLTDRSYREDPNIERLWRRISWTSWFGISCIVLILALASSKAFGDSSEDFSDTASILPPASTVAGQLDTAGKREDRKEFRQNLKYIKERILEAPVISITVNGAQMAQRLKLALETRGYICSISLKDGLYDYQEVWIVQVSIP